MTDHRQRIIDLEIGLGQIGDLYSPPIITVCFYGNGREICIPALFFWAIGFVVFFIVGYAR